ncbi:MAG: ATP-grasp domain-containing protein [Pseudomonadota bacterium]
MQWILQEFEDTENLAGVLSSLNLPFSMHKVIPFVGDLEPRPVIADPLRTVVFGAYSLWRFSERHGLHPGVFRIAPFIDQPFWSPYLLNGRDALRMTLAEVTEALPDNEDGWFMRPVDDSKAEPGRVRSASEIREIARRVGGLREDEVPIGSLRSDTELMFAQPVNIRREWRLWVVRGQMVTYSLYRDGRTVTYRRDIDADALAFGQHMVELHPDYAPAYVIDICRTNEGLRILETNCMNAAGFYEADLTALVGAIEALD